MQSVKTELNPIQRRHRLPICAWRPKPALRYEDWIEQGRKLGLIGRSVGWWIGDWLMYGNAAYGERYARAARVTGYDVQTLMNMVYVASRVETSRRRENLSWSHHAEVAALTPEEQDRWLDRAEIDRLSVRCLRDAIRREQRQLEAVSAADAARGSEGAQDEHCLICPSCGHTFVPDSDELEAAGEHQSLDGRANGHVHRRALSEALPS